MVAAVIGFYMLNKVMNPNEIMVTKSDASAEQITIKGGFTDSVSRYRGYKASFENNTLYIKIKGSKLPFGGNSGDFNISLANTYGQIDKIYLQGTGNTKKLIWPNN